MAKKVIRAADLFCGAGGTSRGLQQACEIADRQLELSAVNHWQRAVETHAKNHPTAYHACEDLSTMDPRKAVPGGKLDLLVASPECTHHSVARGGVPMSDQSRASAWCVLRWATALQVDRILIENVKEFKSWGPLGANGRPLKSKRGDTFQAFINSLRSLGYKVDWRILNAANFGDATTRERLFVQAVKGRRQINWPTASHARTVHTSLTQCKPWRPAREIIDWSMRGTSIFGRKRPLSENTLKRIEAGLRKFGGKNAEPFLLILRGKDRYTRSIGEPVPTISAGGTHVGLCEPFIMACTHQGGDRVQDLNGPLPTITTAKRGEHALIEPFILSAGGPKVGARSVDDPMNTALTPHRQFKQMDVDSIDDPIRTLTASNGGDNALIEPFLVPYYGTARPDSINEPVATVTTKDRLGLVEPVQLDILFRMLQPHELAAAMSFPRDYYFAGNRKEVVRQIGNAVPVNVAQALCAAMLEDAA